MIDLEEIISWLRYRRLKKQREADAKAHKRLFEKTVTVHGRIELGHLVKDEEGLPPEIRRMYYGLLIDAPLKEWSVWN